MRQDGYNLTLWTNLVLFKDLPQIGQARWVCCDYNICCWGGAEWFWSTGALQCFWCCKLNKEKNENLENEKKKYERREQSSLMVWGGGEGKKSEDFWGITWFSGVIEGGSVVQSRGPRIKNWLLINCNEVVVMVDVVVVVVVGRGGRGILENIIEPYG